MSIKTELNDHIHSIVLKLIQKDNRFRNINAKFRPNVIDKLVDSFEKKIKEKNMADLEPAALERLIKFMLVLVSKNIVGKDGALIEENDVESDKIEQIINPLFEATDSWVKKLADIPMTDHLKHAPPNYFQLVQSKSLEEIKKLPLSAETFLAEIKKHISNLYSLLKIGKDESIAADYVQFFYNFILPANEIPSKENLLKLRVIKRQFITAKLAESEKEEVTNISRSGYEVVINMIEILEKYGKERYLSHQMSLKKEAFSYSRKLQDKIANQLIKPLEVLSTSNEFIAEVKKTLLLYGDVEATKFYFGDQQDGHAVEEEYKKLLGDQYGDCKNLAKETWEKYRLFEKIHAGIRIFDHLTDEKLEYMSEIECEEDEMDLDQYLADDVAIPSEQQRVRLYEVVTDIASLGKSLGDDRDKVNKGTALNTLSDDLKRQLDNHYRKPYLSEAPIQKLKQEMIASVDKMFNSKEVKYHVNPLLKNIATAIKNALLIAFAIPTLGATLGLKKYFTGTWTFHATTNTQEKLEEQKEKIIAAPCA